MQDADYSPLAANIAALNRDAFYLPHSQQAARKVRTPLVYLDTMTSFVVTKRNILLKREMSNYYRHQPGKS